MSTDWAYDPRTGLPFSGNSVQAFIKRSFNTKVGAGLFDASDMVLYLFKDEFDKEEFDLDRSKIELLVGTIPMRFETTQYRIRITPTGNTNVNVSVNAETVNLEMALQAEKRELGDAVWEPTNQDIGVRVYVDARNTGNYEEIPELAQVVLASNGVLNVDVRQYLPIGLSRFRFYFYAVDDPTLSSSLVWNITLAEMYIEEWGNTWYRPLIESVVDENYHFGGFKIVGTIGKILHIEVSTALSQVAYFERDIASLEAIESPYYFTRNDGLDLLHPVSDEGVPLQALPTGIYSVKVWLTSGELTTIDNAITYNIMYIAPGDEYTARLAVMNDSGKEVNNYDESAHLCDYAVYNAGETYGTPTITITPYIAGTPEASTIIESSIFTSTKQSLIHSINVVTSRDNLTIRYRVTMPDNYQEDVSNINNTEIFPSEDGAVFYLNTSLRSNGESTKEIVYNTANNSTVALDSVNWSGMSWVDGIDGWDVDDEGRKCLFLPARTRLEIPNESFNFLPGENITIELCYKVINVADYSENIITIAQNPNSDSFLGLRIKPTNITVHSGSDSTSGNDIYQGTNLIDEEVVHLVLTIQRSFGDHNGFNLVTGYVNGVKNFQFSYQSGTIWSSRTATAIFGSDTADLCLYMVRAYNKPLSSSGAENNWLNSLTTRDEKAAYRHFIDSILQSSSRNISYDKIKDEGKYNFFVVEMTSGGTNVPTMSYPNGGRSNIEMHFGLDENGNPMSDRDWKIYDVETKGQGTTSMNYWLWNIRWRIDKTDSSKKRDVAYYDTPVVSSGVRTFVELPKSSSKTVWFDGEGNHPAVKRITAKINFASSMQSHKMGATGAYSALHDSLLEGAMLNEAQQYAEANNLPSPTVAVYQYPAYGFQRIVTNGKESYTFIGLFTIGPDKGDKPTFGYDLVDEENLVTLEGVDHTPQMTKFNVPWDEQSAYYVNSSGDGFLASKAPSGNYQNAVEVGNAGTADTSEPSEAMPVLVATFKPAYDVVYNNSTLIFPVSLSDSLWGGSDASEVIANINANITDFQRTRYNSRFSYSELEFWIEGDYKLYHYEYESGQYVSGYKSGGAYGSPLDLRADTGITDSQLAGFTLEEQNDLFKEARRERFVQQAPVYWDMNELAFNYAFLLVFGATDNFAKNQYPYYMGGKWRFRQDDLDTIEDIDNNGGQTKPYDIEFNDTVNGSPYFAGSNSVLWNLVNESLWSDYTVNGVSYTGITSMGKKMMEQMSVLAHGDDDYDGFIKFFEKYFWGKAQGYFPQSAYNIDGNIKYEAAWLTGRSFSANPLRQSLGNHYSAERLWVSNRALYCMSMFGVGSFGNYEDASLGRIQFRPIDLGTMTLTPARSMYPCLIIGDNDIRPTERTMAGNEYEFDSLVGDGQTVYTIQGVHNLTSLGDLKNLNLGPLDGGTFNVSGKKLRTLKFGDADASVVTTNLVNLSIDSVSGLPCLEILDLRNADTISGSLDLSNCKRVKEVYTEGTNVAAVILPRGSKIEKLHLSDNVTTLSYQVIKYLSDLELPSDASAIALLYLEECDALDSMGTLEEIYDTDGQSLSYIKLLWGTEKNTTGKRINMLAHIAQNIDKDGENHPYSGVDPNGSGSTSLRPSIEGRLFTTGYYQADLDAISSGSTPTDSESHPGLKQIQASYFGPLYITYSLGDRYIAFADENVLSGLLNYGIGDGFGITITQAENTTNLNSAFENNTDISTFDEFSNFVNVESMVNILKNSSVQKVTLPSGLVFTNDSSKWGGLFSGCTSLSEIDFNDSVRGLLAVNASFGWFENCSSLTTLRYSSIEQIFRLSSQTYNAVDIPFAYNDDEHHVYVDGVELTSLVIPNTVERINPGEFYGWNKFTSIAIPSTVQYIGDAAFRKCSSLTSASIPSMVTTLYNDTFNGCSSLEEIHFDGHVMYGSDVRDVFAGCERLTKISFNNLDGLFSSGFYGFETQYPSRYCPFGVTQSGHVYVGGTELINVVVPNNVVSIGASLFAYCKYITSLSFEANSSLTNINSGAFYGCNNLTGTVNIPSGVTSIEDNAFDGAKITSLTLPDTLTKIDYAAFRGNSFTSVTIPSSVFSVGNYAFADCSNLITFTLPSSVTGVCPRGLCADCTSLQEIIFDGITEFGYNLSSLVIDNCNSLLRIVMPSVVRIDNSVYLISRGGTALSELDLGPNVTFIGIWMFGTQPRQLDRFICRAEVPPAFGKFHKKPQRIYVPYSSDGSILNAYKNATGWIDWQDVIFELDSNGNVPA